MYSIYVGSFIKIYFHMSCTRKKTNTYIKMGLRFIVFGPEFLLCGLQIILLFNKTLQIHRDHAYAFTDLFSNIKIAFSILLKYRVSKSPGAETSHSGSVQFLPAKNTLASNHIYRYMGMIYSIPFP